MMLVEEVRIGALDGPEEQMFGFIQAIAVDSRGGIYVFDGQVPALRHFDSAGQYVRTLGRKGAGPGEYQDGLGLAFRGDGRLIVHDPRNGRLTLYHPDGTASDHWPVVSASRLYISQAMTVDTADHVYLKILLGPVEPNRPWPIGLLHMDAEGRVVDSISAPTMAGEPGSDGSSFTPAKVWAFSPLGFFVVGVNDRYAFEVRRQGRSVTRIERSWDPIRLTPEERAEHEAFREWTIKTEGRSITSPPPPISSIKPAYRQFDFGSDDRIWVWRHTSSVKDTTVPPPTAPDQPPAITWREPVVWDVFQEDGTYLGEVRVPPRTELLAFGRELVWGTLRGDQDETYVVRFRLAPGAPPAAR